MDIPNEICRIVAARLETPDEMVGLETDLRSLPNFDSIHALQIVLDVEQFFDIEIEDEVTFEVQTVREFAARIEESIAARSSAPAGS
jgi:acyl carrier protein